MRASYEATMVVPVAAEAVWQRAMHVLNSHPRVEYVSTEPGVLTAETGVTWRSWGENITIHVDERPDGTHVRIRSKCVLVTQFVSWGKNRANVQLIRAGLEFPTSAESDRS